MDKESFDWDAPWLTGVRVVSVGNIEKLSDGSPGIELWTFMADETAPPLSANDLVRMSEAKADEDNVLVQA